MALKKKNVFSLVIGPVITQQLFLHFAWTKNKKNVPRPSIIYRLAYGKGMRKITIAKHAEKKLKCEIFGRIPLGAAVWQSQALHFFEEKIFHALKNARNAHMHISLRRPPPKIQLAIFRTAEKLKVTLVQIAIQFMM